MFCPNCGTNLPDGTQVCTNCGNPMQQPQYQQPQYQQPQYQPQYQQPQYQPQYQQPQYQPQYQQSHNDTSAGVDRDAMSKREFISHTTNKDVKRNALVVTITMLLCLVLIGGSIFATLSMPFYNIPAMSAIFSLAGVEPGEVQYELVDALTGVRMQLAYYGGGLTGAEKELADEILDNTEKLLENFSILNFRGFLTAAEKTFSTYTIGLNLSEFYAVAGGVDVIIGVLIGFFFLPLLFTLLGGLLKSSGLTVAGLIFTLLAQVVFCGWLFALGALALYIAQAVFCSKITKAYRDFTLGLAPL